MNKGNFETYEFVPSNGADNDQFFVVQDNGTFMISRQPVQYEAQNVKDALETVQVFNVTPQQFLVDINNSTELISVSDQFIIPDTNLYANSYLLQPGTSTPTEPMQQESSQAVAVEFKQAESLVDDSVITETNKQTNSCTEITLTDEQYQMLEQKGWILLEISEKMYLLDTLGLHDITTNPKLIEKLKNENQGSGNLKLENGVFVNCPIENNPTLNIEAEESKQCLIENNITTGQAVTEEMSSLGMNVDDNNIYDEVKAEIPNASSDIKDDVHKEDIEIDTRVLVIENENIRRIGNTLKVKTKLSLKDFPDKIILGKTINGKNLIAKVVKPNYSDNRELRTTKRDKPDENSQSLEENIIPATNLNSDVLSESEFYALIQHFFKNNIMKCSSADVVTADTIISQLLQIPTFKSSVVDNNLIITKSLQTENLSGESVNKGLTAIVTGTVTQIADQFRFVHLPHMLQNMVNDTEEYLKKRRCSEPMTLKKESYDVLHVQISEAKQAVTDVVRVSVTVNKRNILPMHLVANRQKLHLSPIYACSFCASLFDTEKELKEHQTHNCCKHEDVLTIDMDQFAKTSDYCVIKTGKTKSYACMQCDAKFNRLASCKNHLKTHFTPESPKSQTENNSNKTVYKCNMCSSTYFHPSTLSKHIVSRHIKINS